MSARSSASVSNSVAAFARSSSTGGSTFSLTSLSVTAIWAVVPSTSSCSMSFVSPGDMPDDRRPRAPRRAATLPSSTTTSRRASPSGLTTSITTTSPSARRPIASGDHLGHARAKRLDLGVDELLREPRPRACRPRASSSPARSIFGCTATVAVNCERRLGRVRQRRTRNRAARSAGCARVAAAFRNQPPMWLDTASSISRSLPTRAMRTGIGTFPLRKPGILTLVARSEAACSTACSRSCCGTETDRRTLSSGSCSTVASTRAIQPEGI